MDFGELRNDEKFSNSVLNFSRALDKIEQSLNTAVEFKDFEELSTREKVKLDTYLAYAINSLYWMHVKLRGDDPNEHSIKNELSRVRQTIIRDKQIYDRNTIRPVLDKAAAGRFIQHGLHVRFDENGERITESSSNIKAGIGTAMDTDS
ncbi:PREDICTED: nuclear nucleic acid-binding protein C1D [Rhagoletis zephyria]|uniref:nuclear nucleic acid-binding protein C1D n=1 Tax=Rhagoletis zephyria TaxID=28612 RepID=UPI00081124E8|nr:PREDICTED: nuclear nucleic acid-binding protein C1D [Rhagoletis zephyria]XP_036339722.1 nuclear nucleic acid-binding protein C1D [Rhagoletis pomonella]